MVRLSYDFYSKYIITSKVSFQCILQFIFVMAGQPKMPKLSLLDMKWDEFIAALNDAGLDKTEDQHHKRMYNMLKKTKYFSTYMTEKKQKGYS